MIDHRLIVISHPNGITTFNSRSREIQLAQLTAYLARDAAAGVVCECEPGGGWEAPEDLRKQVPGIAHTIVVRTKTPMVPMEVTITKDHVAATIDAETALSGGDDAPSNSSVIQTIRAAIKATEPSVTDVAIAELVHALRGLFQAPNSASLVARTPHGGRRAAALMRQIDKDQA